MKTKQQRAYLELRKYLSEEDAQYAAERLVAIFSNSQERDDEGRTAQDRYDDDCIQQYGCVELDMDLGY